MAELNYDTGESALGDGLPSMAQVINFSGAVISLALIGGLAIWGWQLVKRDVSGVPVVRALEGPMRVAPDDPGGELAVHTGLAVNNVPAEGIAAEPAERLVLADEPAVLVEEDVPAAALAAMSPAPEAEAAPAAPAEPEVMDSAITAALSEATGTVIGPGGEKLTLVSADLGGVTRSLWPVARPEGLAAAPAEPASGDGFREVAPGTIAAGTRLAQLGAFDSRDVAMSEWARLSKLFPEYMTDKTRVIEEAQSGGKLFYRLRAHGFDDLSDARLFCAGMLASDVNCIPVLQR